MALFPHHSPIVQKTSVIFIIVVPRSSVSPAKTAPLALLFLSKQPGEPTAATWLDNLLPATKPWEWQLSFSKTGKLVRQVARSVANSLIEFCDFRVSLHVFLYAAGTPGGCTGYCYRCGYWWLYWLKVKTCRETPNTFFLNGPFRGFVPSHG